MKSWRSSAASMPSAEKCEGNCGTMTVGMCSSRAIAITCSAPAPPEATRAKSRGSKPFCTETSRTASDIFEIAISTIACAAATVSIFRGLAIFSAMPRAARVGVELHLPAEEVVGIEPTEHDIRVSDGRLGAAPAVADRVPDRRPRFAGRP